ncbi:MAG: hypothetical protein ABI647_12690 [Gemmatimonadota bacterium]
MTPFARRNYCVAGTRSILAEGRDHAGQYQVDRLSSGRSFSGTDSLLSRPSGDLNGFIEKRPNTTNRLPACRLPRRGRRSYRLNPAGPDRFLLEAAGADVIELERRGGRVVGIILNPGPWSQRADRRD